VLLGVEDVAGDTPLYDPVDGTTRSFQERAELAVPVNVLSMTLEGIRGVPASTPFLKGTAQMWRVVLEDGRQIVCTSEHKLLTRDGWRKLAQISLRTGIACAGSVTPTIRGISYSGF